MLKPNLFIIGAPKCGTTSLAAWLASHPQVFFSSIKEPEFFNTDHGSYSRPNKLQYERLFSKASPSHSAIGEASVWYLYSQKAVNNILDYSPEAKFIVCLRNPVEMAHSLHEQLFVSGVESIANFEVAWHLQRQRVANSNISKYCSEPKFLIYGDVCSLGEQVERLLSNVARKQVLILLLDDVKEDARKEYLRVLNFLGLEDDGKKTFPVHNTAKALIFPPLQQAALAMGELKKLFGIRRRLGLHSMLTKWNSSHRMRQPLSKELEQELKTYFRADVRRLEEILERDLSQWVCE